MDESHLLAPPVPVYKPFPNMGVASLIVTQAFGLNKRGKKVLIGSTKTADGKPFPPPPKKFLPLQVLRRRAQLG